MSKPVIGVTVGTPTSPAKIADEIKPVKTVNGVAPDENGNVEFEGGAKSWNDLTDKPFYDESVTIEWDGNTEGKTHVDGEISGIGAYKISDLTPEPSELVGAVMTGIFNGNTVTGTIIESMVVDNREYGYPMCSIEYDNGSGAMDVVTVVYAPFSAFTECGIYFGKIFDSRITCLTYGSIKKIDKKFLPETIITANSEEELPNPSTVPENTVALVKSEGGGEVRVTRGDNVITITVIKDGKTVSTAIATYNDDGDLEFVEQDGAVYDM